MTLEELQELLSSYSGIGLNPLHFGIDFSRYDDFSAEYRWPTDSSWYDSPREETVMPEDKQSLKGDILSPGLFSAAMEVLKGHPLHDPEYAYLLTRSGRQEAKRIQQLWTFSERAKSVNGWKSPAADDTDGGSRDSSGTENGSDGSGDSKPIA